MIRFIITIGSLLASICQMKGAENSKEISVHNFSDYRGVWASNDAEAVVTDSVCIFYNHSGSQLEATLEIPSRNISHKTVFATSDSILFQDNAPLLKFYESEGRLSINGREMEKVEDFTMCSPYDMPAVNSPKEIGNRLQEWRLGVNFDKEGDAIVCEVNTNRHMYIYMIVPSMVYIRAAAVRNNDNGTLFFQNIRMMANRNTGEKTAWMSPENYKIASEDLLIDNSKFNPTACTFDPDGGIYWSLISFSPDQILLNGCGETYKFERSTKDSEKSEWIKSRPYSLVL